MDGDTEIYKIIKNLDNYFNHVLRSFLKYNETYHIEFIPNKKRFILTSNLNENKLINIIRNNKSKAREIELQLLSGFRSIYSDILNFNIYSFENNKIIITYTQGENSLELSEIKILAKLALNYDDEKLDEVCKINKNFERACNSNLFWWKIIELKYPEYYRENIQSEYNPKEIIKGLKYFYELEKYRKNKEKYDREYNEDSFFGYKIDYGRYYDDVNLLYEKLSNYYGETLKYLIFENIFILNYNDISFILRNINLLKSIYIGILKHIILNYDIDKNLKGLFFAKNFKYLIFGPTNNSKYKKIDLKLADDIYDTLESKKMLNTIGEYDSYDLEYFLDYDYVNKKSDDNPEVYEWVLKKLNKNNSKRYLEDYIDLSEKNKNIMNYILDKDLSDIPKDTIINGLVKLIYINGNPFIKFKNLYNKFKYYFNDEDRKYLLQLITQDYHNRNNWDPKDYKKLLS